MIVLQNISKTFGHRHIFKDISYNCHNKAKVALIGNNGAGKTTLLNILCGFEQDYNGNIIKPKNLRLGYLPQVANPSPEPTILAEALSGAQELNKIMQEREEVLASMATDYSQDNFDRYEYLEQMFQSLGGYRIEDDTKEVLQGLGFQEEQPLDPVTSLSGGWRMRLEFAKILLNSPNFLILDEPTNHLDLPSIEWFEGYLKRFNGTVIFVSHDKDLLNRLATHVLHLREGKLTPYTGNFDDFLEAFALKQEQSTHTAKNLKTQTDHIEQFVNRFRASPSKAKMVQSRIKTLAKLKMIEDDVVFEKLGDTMQLTLENPNPSGKTVLEVNGLVVGYDSPLIRDSSFTVYRGQKVAILGANGLGKSTLLKTLLGKQAALGGDIVLGHNVVPGYFAQEHLDDLREGDSVLDNINRLAPTIKESDARRLLSNLGLSGDGVFKRVSVLSGGEKSRTSLACILAQRPNLLFLDEPTNHLDLSACENLTDALSEFAGTVIFVSHNRAFIHGVATHVIHLKERGKKQAGSVRIEEI